MIVVLLIVIAVGGFFAYKKFGPKKEVKQAPPASKKIQSTHTATGANAGGRPSNGDSGYYSTNRKDQK